MESQRKGTLLPQTLEFSDFSVGDGGLEHVCTYCWSRYHLQTALVTFRDYEGYMENFTKNHLRTRVFKHEVLYEEDVRIVRKYRMYTREERSGIY